MSRPFAVDMADLREKVLAALRGADGPITVEEIRVRCPTDPPPQEHHVRRVLAQLGAECLVRGARVDRFRTEAGGRTVREAPATAYEPTFRPRGKDPDR